MSTVANKRNSSGVSGPTRPRRGRDAPRPDWVDINGRVWDIEWSMNHDEFRKACSQFPGDMDDVEALTDHHHLTIRMCTEIHLTLQRENLLHEVMHAIMFGVRADHGEDAKIADADWEEHYVSVLDAPLLAVLKRNPHLLAWLMAGG